MKKNNNKLNNRSIGKGYYRRYIRIDGGGFWSTIHYKEEWVEVDILGFGVKYVGNGGGGLDRGVGVLVRLADGTVVDASANDVRTEEPTITPA